MKKKNNQGDDYVCSEVEMCRLIPALWPELSGTLCLFSFINLVPREPPMPHAIKGVFGPNLCLTVKNRRKGVQHRTHRCMVQVMYVDFDDI